MIKSLAAAAVLAIGMSGVAFADDAPAAAPMKPMMHKGYMCYHTVAGKKVWHHSAKPCAGSMMKKM